MTNNRLTYVKDVVANSPYTDDIENQPTNNYKYDAIGNLVRDASERTAMRWNVGGKLFKVQKTDANGVPTQTVNYEYDATGNRILKEVIALSGAAAGTTRTYYTRDAQGNTLATYTSTIGQPNVTLEALTLYGSSRLGEWRPTEAGVGSGSVSVGATSVPTEAGVGSGSVSVGATSVPTEPVFGIALEPLVPMENAPDWVARRVVAERRYEISNHLGNVLVTVLDRKTTTTTTPLTATTNVTTSTLILATAAHIFRADIATATDYYAFGQPMPTRQYSATWNGSAYRYGFNGKENDNSFDSKTIQDYGFRLYSPALCKFLSVDPLTAKYPELTPYQFASNTPICAIDLDGLEAFFVHGTWANSNTFPKTTISTVCGITGNTQGKTFNWSGNNTDKARKKAAVELADHIMKNRDPNQPLTIFAHSHGGNVGIMAANILKERGVKVDNLITVNTPVREYQLKNGAVGKHINLSQVFNPFVKGSAYDFVQVNGGGSVNIPDGATAQTAQTPQGPTGVVEYTYNGTTVGTGEIGSAGRHFDTAINIDVSHPDYHSTHTKPNIWKKILNDIINPSSDTVPNNTPPRDNTTVIKHRR